MKNLIQAYKLFENRINEVDSYIDNMMSQSDVLSGLLNLEVSEKQKEYLQYLQSSTGKTIQYNAVIISLYGSFENFIDSIISNYLDIVFLNTRAYEELPVKIQGKYKNKIGDFVLNPQHFYGIDTPVIKIIENYFEVLKSNFNGNINKEFLLMHSGNLRMDQVCSIMTELGIENIGQKIFRHPLMKSFQINILGFDENDYDLKVSRNRPEISIYLDKLVEQRNSVAHGWVEENRISVYDLRTYVIPFLKKLSQVILRLLLCEAYIYNVSDPTGFSKTPLKVIDNHIVCLHILGQAIANGDFVIYKIKNDFKCAQITKIEIDREPIDSITGVECDVGFEIDAKITKESEIHMFISN